MYVSMTAPLVHTKLRDWPYQLFEYVTHLVGFTGDFWHKIKKFMKTKIQNKEENTHLF